VEQLCFIAGERTLAASSLTLGDAAPLVRVLSEQDCASCFCFVLVDLTGLASSVSLPVDGGFFCLVLVDLVGAESSSPVEALDAEVVLDLVLEDLVAVVSSESMLALVLSTTTDSS
jgi:hypothetical protein